MATDRFTKENALHELYNYVHEYSNAVSFENTINTFILRIFFYLITAWLIILCLQINEGLEEDQTSSAQQLPAKLGHVITSMEGPSASGPSYVWPKAEIIYLFNLQYVEDLQYVEEQYLMLSTFSRNCHQTTISDLFISKKHVCEECLLRIRIDMICICKILWGLITHDVCAIKSF